VWSLEDLRCRQVDQQQLAGDGPDSDQLSLKAEVFRTVQRQGGQVRQKSAESAESAETWASLTCVTSATFPYCNSLAMRRGGKFRRGGSRFHIF